MRHDRGTTYFGLGRGAQGRQRFVVQGFRWSALYFNRYLAGLRTAQNPEAHQGL